MKIAIIGAGPAGMTAAYILSQNGYNVDIYESAPMVGGLSATIELWGQKVDIGPHRFFSTDKRVNSLWLEQAKSDYEMVNRLTRIYYKNRFYYYPIKLFNVMQNIGIKESFNCILSYVSEKIKPTKQNGSFENWVQSRFGKRLYEIFFKTYSEKLWGIKCTNLDVDFAAQRIKDLSMFEAVKNAILGGKNNKHQTLIDQFAYPKGGSGVIYERMAKSITKNGSNIFLNSPVYCILQDQKKITGIELIDGKVKTYDHIISTMPFTQMINRMPGVPAEIKNHAEKLNYRNTIIVYLLINNSNIFSDNWLYIHSSDLQMGRITNFRNWSSTLYGNDNKTILAIEYWCNENDKMWNSQNSEIIQQATKELIKTGLVNEELIEDGYVHKINKSYPVYKKGYKDILNPIEKYIAGFEGLSVIGRNGSFKYNNQDHSILMGLYAAENVMGKANHTLSKINSDYETYQESCVISETGLTNQ
ncbi:MAG: FAD-dependent oxidoreductase [Prolixibacteraceae bacterium]|jgi:protoporphyrinogen oxidase|nr:FAD-dependent oxidoreductase [Prolixibacteraceae bacterium]